jgi:hypothetical protein
MPHASNELGGDPGHKKGTAVLARGTQNMAQKVPPHQAEERQRDTVYQQEAISEQSCLFLEILLFIIIFLPSK